MSLGQFIIIITFCLSLCVRVQYTMSFVYRICSIRLHGYYLFCPSILCSFYSRVATIQERHLFSSVNPFADIEESKVAQNDYQTDKETYWLLLIGLLCCFEFASLVHNKFSREHMLHMQVFVTPTTATIESGIILFSTCAWRCGYCSRAATNQERRLIERIQYLTCLVSSIIPTLEQEVMTCLMYTNYYTFLHKLGDIVIFHLANFTPVYCHPHTSCSVWQHLMILCL